MENKLSYEQSVSRLEEIVKLLENGELPLEESMKLFVVGSRLSAECYGMLSKGEQKITQISDVEINEEEEQ